MTLAMKLNGILGSNSMFKGRLVCWLMLALSCALLSGCEEKPSVIWASRVKSPDGVWVAEAETKQWGGPGNSYVATTVALKWIPKSRRPPIEVLELANESAYPIGVTGVVMKWVTNSHLDVTYGAGARVDFQAIKAAGLNITAHPTTSEAAVTK